MSSIETMLESDTFAKIAEHLSIEEVLKLAQTCKAIHKDVSHLPWFCQDCDDPMLLDAIPIECDCCEVRHCESCTVHCDNTGEDFCYDCCHFCEECDQACLCCVKMCEACDKIKCDDCQPMSYCDSCNVTNCFGCKQYLQCEECLDTRCRDCWQDFFICHQCERSLCHDCHESAYCEWCDEILCENCEAPHYQLECVPLAVLEEIFRRLDMGHPQLP